MSNVVIKFTPNTTTIKTSMAGMSLAMFSALFDAYIGNIGEYDSDEAALAGGVASGEWYITSDNHVSAPGGTLKQNRL